MADKKIFYMGKLNEAQDVFTEGSEDGVMIKEAEMFSVGTHRGTEYTEEDLNTLAKNFDPAQEIPVQLDHSDSARDTVGYIEEVSVKGGKLLGKLKILDSYAKERITSGLMKKLSIGFYLKETEEGLKPSALREVSLVAFPQVKSARLFSENGYVSDYEQEEGKNVAEKDMQINLADITAQVKAQVEEQFSKDLEALENQVESLKGVKAELSEVQIENKIEKFSAESKVVPAQNDSLKKLLASFTEEQAQAFDEFMGNSHKVDFTEQAEFNQETGDADEKDERTPEQIEFDKFYEEHSSKYGKTL